MQMFQRHSLYHIHLRKVFVANCLTQSAILTAILFYCVLFREKLKLFMVDRIEWLLKYCIYLNTADQ